MSEVCWCIVSLQLISKHVKMYEQIAEQIEVVK